MEKDLSGQVKEVLVATENGAKDHKVKRISGDPTRYADELRKAVPPTPLSQKPVKH